MKIEGDILKYLNNEAFTTTLTFDILKEKQQPVSREKAIVEMIKGKNIIHIGCSDHIQIINEKIYNNTWLHKLLTEKGNKCLGIDIDKESIDFVQEKLGYKNVIHGNIIIDDIALIKEDKWDYAVFGEIIEHLDDPVSFLKAFKLRYEDYVSRFIITVPNIYNKRQFLNMLDHKEIINSDHRFWFTPYTISKVIATAGYKPETITFSNLQSLNNLELIIRKLKRITGMEIKYPFYYFNTIIISGALK